MIDDERQQKNFDHAPSATKKSLVGYGLMVLATLYDYSKKRISSIYNTVTSTEDEHYGRQGKIRPRQIKPMRRPFQVYYEIKHRRVYKVTKNHIGNEEKENIFSAVPSTYIFKKKSVKMFRSRLSSL